MLRLVPITALILAGTFSVARADVFRWVDEKGVTALQRPVGPGLDGHQDQQQGAPTELGPIAPRSAAHSRERRDLRQLADQANARAVQQDVAKAKRRAVQGRPRIAT